MPRRQESPRSTILAEHVRKMQQKIRNRFPGHKFDFDMTKAKQSTRTRRLTKKRKKATRLKIQRIINKLKATRRRRKVPKKHRHRGKRSRRRR